MTTYLMQAVSSTTGLIYGWQSATADFSGTGFPGPGSPQNVAVAGKTVGGAGVQISKFPNDLSPFALWNFDRTLNDTSGNGRHLSGTPAFIDIYPGFAGVRGGTVIRNDQNFNIKGDITILSMVQVNSYIEYLVFAFLGDSESSGDNAQYQLAVYALGAQGVSYFCENGAGNNVFVIVDNVVPFIHNLFFAGFVGASNVVQLWINGYKVGSPTTLAAPTDGTTAQCRVGTAGDGAVGAVKFWNRALSDSEVKQQYNVTMGGVFGTV